MLRRTDIREHENKWLKLYETSLFGKKLSESDLEFSNLWIMLRYLIKKLLFIRQTTKGIYEQDNYLDFTITLNRHIIIPNYLTMTLYLGNLVS